MSFFIRKAGGGSRPQPRLKGGKKRVGSSTKANHTNKKSKVVSKSRHVDEIVSSESEAENDLRLAKKYLAEIERQEKEKLDAQEVDRSVVSHRLRTDLLEQSGQLHKKIADNGVDKERMLVLKGHKLPVTCVTVSQDGQHIFSGSKDCAIIKWCAKTGKKLFTVPDGMYLASGCQLKMIFIWNPSTMQQLHIFQGHRGPVMGLAFRTGSHQLYSCSADRSVKVWNLDEMAYVETLRGQRSLIQILFGFFSFGHQDAVTAIDSYTRERAVTAGSRDNTLRVWKIPEESQLVYQSHNCSVDCAKMINEQHFVSGADDGSLSLWSALKKKPTSVHHQAHGSQDGAPRWITAVASLRCTDLIASGSWNGEVKLWSSGDECKKLKEVASIPVEGFVNALVFNSSGDVLVAAVGQEHRLGRWWKLKEARNCVIVLPLIFKDV
ncbi:hypothetical protein MRX96_011522 [Rhipicephalus microplus]